MTDIDIGSGASNRATYFGATQTIIDKNNPANATGKLSSFEVWFNSNATGVKIGTFSGTGSNYDDRDYESIGAVTAGSKQTFSGLDVDVTVGDFIGLYAATGEIDVDTTGGASGVYWVSGDKFGLGTTTYPNTNASYQISMYGAGIEIIVWANITKILGVRVLID